MSRPQADICLIVEGSYPYVRGGVSSWIQDLITSQTDYTFSVVSLVSSTEGLELMYPKPENLIDISTHALSNLPRGYETLTRKQSRILAQMEKEIIAFVTKAGLGDLKRFLELIKELGSSRGSAVLLDSPAAWEVMLNSYKELMPQSAFIDYFWSFRVLLESFYSVLLLDLPQASLYHTTCTGYAGLLGARCALETGRPLLLTEHGIYTNERRVELLSAEWLYRTTYSRSYAINKSLLELRDLWIPTFANYSKICYEASEKIVTLFNGNQLMQAEDGASREKMMVIPNGVDYARYSSLPRQEGGRAPTVAFIGRVVPIKDVKTFIRSIGILRGSVPGLQALIMGPHDEDPGYYQECVDMIEHLKLTDCIEFTGNVNLTDYLPKIDVLALTSISESQPLVILEAGAAGIPSVATRVGACPEIILGKGAAEGDEGAGGVVVSLSNPVETADAMHRLLTDKAFYSACSQTIRERVQKHYNRRDQHTAYRELYASYVNGQPSKKAATWQA